MIALLVMELRSHQGPPRVVRIRDTPVVVVGPIQACFWAVVEHTCGVQQCITAAKLRPVSL